MVLFLGRSQQKLTGKIDVFSKCLRIFLLSIAAKREILISRFYQRRHAEAMKNLFYVNSNFLWRLLVETAYTFTFC